MKIKKLLVLSTALLVSLVSCGDDISSSNTSSTNSSTTPTSSSASSSEQGGASSSASTSTTSSETSTSSSSSSSEAEKYVVKINTPSGVTITADKEKYLPSETVVLTVSCSAGVTIDSVLYNKKVANKVNDTTYTFIMPARSVTVTATASISGELTIQGDALASFSKEGNIYVARNVKFNSGNGDFKVVIAKDGKTSIVEFSQIDRTKCFADFDLPSTGYTGKLATGVTYDFYYDASNGARPLYVKRVNVDVLPNSVETLDSLFDGAVQSNKSAFPDNLTSISVNDSELKSIYTWEYDSTDNESLATLTNKDTGAKDYIYKKYDANNAVFKWVDTTATFDSSYAISNGLTGKAGTYKVTNYMINSHGETEELNSDQEWEETRQYINPLVAPFEVSKRNTYDLYNLERLFMEAYRVGITVQDYVKSSSVDISSVATGDGFTTTLVSSKTYDSSSSTDSGVTQEKIHYEYRATIKFGKAGQFKSIDYKQYTFDDSTYNFTTDTFISGTADENLSKGTLAKTLVASYTYEEDIDVDFDSNKYFISSITNATISNSAAGTGNILNSGDQLNATEYNTGVLKYVKFDYAPSSALDSWQYGVTASSDESVVKWNDSYRRYEADKTGTSTLTISNQATKTPKVDVEVTVAYNIKVRSIYMNGGVYGSNRNEYVVGDDVTANAANIYAGKVSKIKLGASGNDPTGEVALPPDLSATVSDDSLGVSVSFDTSNNDMYIDATKVNITTDTKVKLTLNSKYFQEKDGSAQTPSVFTITIKPFVNIASLEGTYTCAQTSNAGTASLTVKPSDQTIQVTNKDGDYNLIDLVVGDDSYKLAYKFNSSTGKFTSAIIVTQSGDTYTYNYDYDVKLVYDSTQGIGVYLAKSSWSGQDSVSEDEILGYNDGDDDYLEYYYDYFTKVA